jgi:HSP20 family protein
MLTYFDSARGSLWRDLERFQRHMDLLTGQLSGMGLREMTPGGFPALNVTLSEEQVDVYLFAPGLDRESLDASLQDNLLTVSGERKVPLPEDVQLHRNERFQGRFRRVLSLPKDVTSENIEASYRDGVLHLKIGRRPKPEPNRITIQ